MVAALATLTALVRGRTVQSNVNSQRIALGQNSYPIQGAVPRVLLQNIADQVKTIAHRTSIVWGSGHFAQRTARKQQTAHSPRSLRRLAKVLRVRREPIV